MSDGSNQLVQWLEPPVTENQSLNQANQDKGFQSLPAFPLIASEIIGPPDGMVKQEFEYMLHKGDMVHDARFMCCEVMISKAREWVSPIQAGRVAEVLGGCRTPHIIELATHENMLAKRIVTILDLPQLENYIMHRPFLQFPDPA
eukprot:7669008-Heterocapsa_arctica.AAC.1